MTEVRAFSVQDVGILVLEAVAVLHRRGHERLRIKPGMSASGAYWRTSITSADGAPDQKKVFHYTTGAEFEVAGEPVDRATTPEELADRILAVLPEDGRGRDPEYVRWYAGLMELVRRHRRVPVSYADYFDQSKGWSIGWGGSIRVPHPPEPGPALESTFNGRVPMPDTLTGPTFTGTVSEFKRYLGPRWKNVVNGLPKKHKAAVGQCQHCGTDDGLFDAAHVHGRERITLIHGLLGSSDPTSTVSVDITAFESAFVAEHHPIEKTILVLCPKHHKAYDAGELGDIPLGEPAPDITVEVTPAKPTAASRTLPITLEPRGVARFKAALLETRFAWIDITYADGRVERQPWKAEKFTENSNVLGNLRSRPSFRQGEWQKLGVVAVHVTVATS